MHSFQRFNIYPRKFSASVSLIADMSSVPEGDGSSSPIEYQMNIQGSVIEQLGLKQYDTVSAVVAELVANAWDADAEEVKIELPLGTYLATRSGGELSDRGYEIVVRDDGHGMDPEQANGRFLNVGRKKRVEEDREVSRNKERPLMGRKGIGKLAPFGLCYTIEVRSAGGRETDEGYEVSHFKMVYEDIENCPPGDPYEPPRLEDDGTYDEETGTEIRLKDFDYKRVPNKEQFSNKLSYRFADGLPDFNIKISDSTGGIGIFDLSETNQPLRDDTVIDVSENPLSADGEEYIATGEMGLATESYDNELQGVRIYVRGKLATVTRDFKIPSGFHMENTIRSYLVGEIHCDFLDEDMDCIQANRQDILWDTKYGRALKEWGQERVREVASKSKDSSRERTSNEFFEATDFEDRVEERFEDEEMVNAGKKLGRSLAGTLDEDELDDEEFLNRFVELILQVTPHDHILRIFKKIREEADSGSLDMEVLADLISKTSVAETYSLAQLASEKVDVINELERKVLDGVEDEGQFQSIVEDATWLLNPEWKPISSDEGIKRFREQFESWYEQKYEEELTTTTTSAETKRPDFVMVSRGNVLLVIEIKPPGHVFRSSDLERFTNYFRAFEEFKSDNQDIFRRRFPDGIKFILIADETGLNYENERLLNGMLDERGYGEQPTSWREILETSRARYNEFLDAVGQSPE